MTLVDACCALYGAPGAEVLFGESMHPGGLALTERGARLAGIGADSRVLDAGCGVGASALFLAERFGCRVLGIDASPDSIERARSRAARSAARNRLDFRVGDLGRLALAGERFDAALAECVCSTLEPHADAVGTLARALGPGGRLVLSDVVRRGAIPDALRTPLGYALCLGGCVSAEELAGALESRGFIVLAREDRTADLVAYARQIRRRLPLLQAAAFLGHWRGAGVLEEIRAVAEVAEAAIEDGVFGYALFVASVPSQVVRA